MRLADPQPHTATTPARGGRRPRAQHVDEHGRYRRGRTPSTAFRLTSRHVRWITRCSGSWRFSARSSTLLRTATVREAGGFADTDIAEDWQLPPDADTSSASIKPYAYHRHANAARTTRPHQPTRTLRHDLRRLHRSPRRVMGPPLSCVSPGKPVVAHRTAHLLRRGSLLRDRLPRSGGR